MKIQLSDIEFERIARYTKQLSIIEQKIRELKAQGIEIMDVLNTSWLVANQRAKLENPDFLALTIPTMVDAQGNALVRLNSQDKTAEWDDPEEASEHNENT